MPTSASTIFSAAKLTPAYNAEDAITIPVSIKASAGLLAAGTVLGEVSATPGTYAAYASGNSDGSQVAKCILMYDVYVDASGNITYTKTSGQVGGPWGEVHKATPAYFSGFFFTKDLTGLDSTAISSLFARFVSGSSSTLTAATTIVKF